MGARRSPGRPLLERPRLLRSDVSPSPGNQLHRLLRQVEDDRALDPAAERLSRRVEAVVARARVKDALTGAWFGHAPHPVLTDFADGAWMAASFLDLFGPAGAAPASRRLVGFGMLAALPTAATGLAEWADTGGRARRVGLVHAGTSTAAFVLYGCSYLARRRRRHRTGVVLGVVGGVVAILDGYVGGHLSLALGVGVAQTAPLDRPGDWTPAIGADELAEGRPTPARVDGTELVLVRKGEEVLALADRCTYRGGRLHEGELRGDAIVCPRHGCTFRLSDGAVLRGPASIPQPSFEARVHQGRVEVREMRAGLR